MKQDVGMGLISEGRGFIYWEEIPSIQNLQVYLQVLIKVLSKINLWLGNPRIYVLIKCVLG